LKTRSAFAVSGIESEVSPRQLRLSGFNVFSIHFDT